MDRVATLHEEIQPNAIPVLINVWIAADPLALLFTGVY